MSEAVVETRRPTLFALVRYFLGLGTFGFGGPIALSGAMRRDLVDARGWFTPGEYREGFALAQLAPGPMAAQLAMYLGWVHGGVPGSALVGFAFVLPSFAMVVALAVLYLRFGGLAWMSGVFLGIGAAVIAIIARGAWRLLSTSVAGDRLLWVVAGGSAVLTAWTEAESVWLFLSSGVLVLLVRAPPGRRAGASALAPWLVTGFGVPASLSTLASVFWYFALAGSFVFGSGLAIVPFLHGGVVNEHHWLTERQFLDAVAVGMATPGPVVITVAFIGYLVAGPLGAVAAAAGVFLPCWLFTVIPAPHFHRLAKNVRVKAFVDGVTAAATGAIVGAAVVLGRRALVDAVTVAVALVALAVLVKLKRVPEPAVVVAAGLVGWAARAA